MPARRVRGNCKTAHIHARPTHTCVRELRRFGVGGIGYYAEADPAHGSNQRVGVHRKLGPAARARPCTAAAHVAERRRWRALEPGKRPRRGRSCHAQRSVARRVVRARFRYSRQTRRNQRAGKRGGRQARILCPLSGEIEGADGCSIVRIDTVGSDAIAR